MFHLNQYTMGYEYVYVDITWNSSNGGPTLQGFRLPIDKKQELIRFIRTLQEVKEDG
jgi:hypothetical protein